MEDELDRKELDEMLKKAGGVENIMNDLLQGQKDHKFFDGHVEEWKKEYPDKWAAVYKEELVAVAGNYDSLVRMLKEKGVPREKTVCHFLSTKPIHWILEKAIV